MGGFAGVICVAGAACRNGNALTVELRQDLCYFAFVLAESDAQVSGQALLTVPENVHIGATSFELFHDMIPKLTQARYFFGKLGLGNCGCGAESDNRGNVLCGGTQAALLPPAKDDRLQPGTFAYVQRTNAFRPVQLVG